jgi:hypothetical protein
LTEALSIFEVGACWTIANPIEAHHRGRTRSHTVSSVPLLRSRTLASTTNWAPFLPVLTIDATVSIPVSLTVAGDAEGSVPVEPLGTCAAIGQIVPTLPSVARETAEPIPVLIAWAATSIEERRPNLAHRTTNATVPIPVLALWTFAAISEEVPDLSIEASDAVRAIPLSPTGADTGIVAHI